MFRRNPASTVVAILALLALCSIPFAAKLDGQTTPTALSIGQGTYGLKTNPGEVYNLLRCLPTAMNCSVRASWVTVLAGLTPSQIPATVTYGPTKEEYSWEACIPGGACQWRSWDRFLHDPALVPVPPSPSDARRAQPWVGLDAGYTSVRSLAYPQANTLGCLALVAVRVGHPTIAVTAVDTQGNPYAVAREQVQPADGHRGVLFYARNIKSGPNTVTVRLASSTTLRFAIGEYCGLDPLSPLDATISAQGSSSAPNSGAAVNVGKLAIGFGTAAFQPSWTPALPYAAQVVVANKLAVEDQIAAPGGGPLPSPITAGFGLSVTDNWTTILATFK